MSTQLNLRFSFAVALVATLGSLYFSEVLKYPPCVLCWYQRICMYPLVLLFGAALWTGEKSYPKFVMPLIVVGLVIALYHNLLYYDVIVASITPCTQGVPCTARQIEYMGFVTIPLMSLMAFLLLTLSNGLVLVRRS